MAATANSKTRNLFANNFGVFSNYVVRPGQSFNKALLYYSAWTYLKPRRASVMEFFVKVVNHF